MKFWDTSALVPLYVHEPNTSVVRELLAADSSIIVWWGTHTECISALMRQVRTGSITSPEERACRHVLHTLAQSWSEIQPSDALRSMAERVWYVRGLNGLDTLTSW